MANYRYEVIPGKMVKVGGFLVDTREDHTVHLQRLQRLGGEGWAVDLTEEEVGVVYQLLGDVTEYAPLTENKLSKLADLEEIAPSG